jgi:predicted O-methyltransferase YrrM
MAGKIISLSRLLRNGPRAFVTAVGRTVFGVRPELPWISYDAQNEIARRLGPEKRALEFGSGMSTAWFAARVAEIISVEDHKEWFDTVSKNFAQREIKSAKLRFAGSKGEYLTLTSEEAKGGFDFVLIDGRYRDECVDVAIANLRPGGCIYLDNSDQIYEDEPNGSCAKAREKLLQWVKATNGEVIDYTDFAPTLFFVTRGELFISR